MKRLLSIVPPGTLAVGAGLGLLGLASYVHLAVAGHLLDEGDMASLSVLWSIVMTVGIGVFFPVEQEVARLVAARRSHGLAPGPVLVRGAAVAAGVLALLVAVIVGFADLLADRLFGGDRGLVWTLAAALAAHALAYPARGVLSGLRLFRRYGLQLGIDGAVRVGLVAAIGWAGVSSPLWYGLVLVLAPVAAVGLTARPVLQPAGSGEALGWHQLLRGLGLLTVSSLLSQVVVNIGVINVRLLAPADVATAGAVLSALVLVRVPLFVFGSVQAALLPALSASAATGERAAFHAMLGRAMAVVTALGGIGGASAVVLGPWLLRAMFDAPRVFTRVDFAWLAAGTLAYLWAVVLGQAVLAQCRHRAQAASWVIGTLTLLAATLAPMPVALRVSVAYAVGSAAVAASLAGFLYLSRAAAPPRPAEALATPAPGGRG